MAQLTQLQPAKPSNFDAHKPPEIELIEDCVHCGFCLPACPTYVLWGEEMDSPRGRIYMIKKAGDGEAPLDSSFRQHMDNCLGSMAAYASAAGLDPIVFIPHGNISYGKLAQALEYGARTFQVEANFDQILALVRVLADRLGIYLLNSINPFRIEGQKTIIFEMLDQRDWNPPDWIVLPGGNLGNTSAFGKALRELCQLGFIHKIPRLAVIQAEGAAPFYEFMKTKGEFHAVKEPRTLATAIRIGDPVSWPKALHEITV